MNTSNIAIKAPRSTSTVERAMLIDLTKVGKREVSRLIQLVRRADAVAVAARLPLGRLVVAVHAGRADRKIKKIAKEQGMSDEWLRVLAGIYRGLRVHHGLDAQPGKNDTWEEVTVVQGQLVPESWQGLGLKEVYRQFGYKKDGQPVIGSGSRTKVGRQAATPAGQVSRSTKRLVKTCDGHLDELDASKLSGHDAKELRDAASQLRALADRLVAKAKAASGPATDEGGAVSTDHDDSSTPSVSGSDDETVIDGGPDGDTEAHGDAPARKSDTSASDVASSSSSGCEADHDAAANDGYPEHTTDDAVVTADMQEVVATLHEKMIAEELEGTAREVLAWLKDIASPLDLPPDYASTSKLPYLLAKGDGAVLEPTGKRKARATIYRAVARSGGDSS